MVNLTWGYVLLCEPCVAYRRPEEIASHISTEVASHTGTRAMIHNEPWGSFSGETKRYAAYMND